MTITTSSLNIILVKYNERLELFFCEFNTNVYNIVNNSLNSSIINQLFFNITSIIKSNMEEKFNAEL